MKPNLHAIQLHVYQANSHPRGVIAIVVLNTLERLADSDQSIRGASQRKLLTQACSEHSVLVMVAIGLRSVTRDSPGSPIERQIVFTQLSPIEAFWPPFFDVCAPILCIAMHEVEIVQDLRALHT
jgi:hypothetical protein